MLYNYKRIINIKQKKNIHMYVCIKIYIYIFNRN